VPVVFNPGFFPYKYTGTPLSAVYYDPVAVRDAITKTILDFEADNIFTLSAPTGMSGLAMEMLGETGRKWSGGPFPPDQSTQTVDLEVMKEDEYDLFITDPGDYMLRYYVPRRYTAMKALSTLPPLTTLANLVNQAPRFDNPEVVKAFKTLARAGEEQKKFHQWSKDVSEMFGMPLMTNLANHLFTQSPFDLFASSLRGMRGTLTDMLRRPDKLKAAFDRDYEWRVARSVPVKPEERGKIRVQCGGNHYQSEEFLSKKQFDTFVWPWLKKNILATIEQGFVPRWFMEGKNDDRIEEFLELPKAKGLMQFEKVDMHRAKSILKDHTCIAGNVPGSLLWGGSPQEVEDYCKDLIKVCGKGGGFILAAAVSLDDAKPANVKAMLDSVHKYGRY
jgi:hypothetical protein